MGDTKRPGDLLFLNENLSDITVRVVHTGVTWRFPAHRLILQHGSTLLDDLSTADQESSTTVTFHDISPENMILMLRYLYMGQIPPLNAKSTFRLLLDAKRFKIEELSDLCEHRLLSNISLQDVCWLMESSSGIGLESISTICENVIKNYAQVIFASQYLLQLSRGSLQRLLAADDLNVVDESVVFSGLWRWAKQECCKTGKELNVQHVADASRDLLQLIRFSEMRDRSVVPRLVLERVQKPPCVGQSKTTHPRLRYRQPSDLMEHCCSVVLQGPRCWEGLRPALASRELCATISVDKDVYLMAVQADVVEQRPQGNVLYICVTKEQSGIEVHRQEVVWADTYERKTARGEEESWLLCDTRFPIPVRLSAGILYSIYLLTVGKPGENFPWQAVGQKEFHVDCQGFHLSMHSAFLISVRKLNFLSVEMAWY